MPVGKDWDGEEKELEIEIPEGGLTLEAVFEKTDK